MIKNVKINKILFFTTLFLGILFSIPSSKVYAASTDNIFGNAWSYNTGWISMNNCTNPANAGTCSGNGYGVNVTGSTISGYAWSDNVGWISFNPTDWGTCPPGASGCTLSSYNNTFSSGWARVMSVPQDANNNSGGWDGWISLGGSGYVGTIGTTDIKSQLGIADVTFEVSGYWWGSDVMGWVDLNSDQSGPNFLKGGVYKSDFSSNGIILTPSSSSILSGDTVNFAWSVSNFTPTSCTGSGTGTDTDWTNVKTVSTSSGTYSNIHVPINTTTVFTLSCTDGSNNASGTASVTAVPLTAGASYNNSCVAPGGSPTISWSTNDPTPSCTINAETTDLMTSYSFGVSGTSPGTEVDTNFQDKNTNYVLSCTNGSGSYMGTASSGQARANVCLPNYTISGATSCGGSPGAIVANNGFGTYIGAVTLTLNPLYGFISDASVSGSAYSGTFTKSPSSGFTYDPLNSIHNTVDAQLSLTTPEYNALLVASPGAGVLEEINLTITGSAQNVNPKSLKIKFCTNSSSTTIKPIFKPF